jgi:hypothetical protein
VSILRDPERGADGEEMVARGEINGEMGEGIVAKLIFSDDNSVTFKVVVGLAMREVEFVHVGADSN